MDPQAARWDSAIECYGRETFEKIQAAKVLVIGAGGIGCELLKNLVLSGFKTIEIVDLDTIDISNLNRQFLFRRRHIGQSKSQVARESALLYTTPSDGCNIIAHHDDVKTLKYGPEYVKQFDLVLNALDNLSARRHVGRICLAAGVPSVESGTAGWLGQVQPFIPGQTGCFECEPKAPPTTFPVCTIRSTPSKPIHTILWAKHLFSCLFGKETDENVVVDLNDTNNSEEANGQTASNGDLTEAIAADQLTLEDVKINGSYGQFIFHKVFCSDIMKLQSMTSLWKDRSLPKLYKESQILDESFNVSIVSNTESSTTLEDQKLWSIRKCTQVFLEVCENLKQMGEEAGPDGLSWDKDIPLHLDFVVAASNLRSSQFGIPLQSKFTVKSDAGNIIPAIATTNAIISGLIVLEAIKILTQQTQDCACVYLVRRPARNGLLVPSKPQLKNPQCYVCSNQFMQIKVDTEEVTLKTLVSEVLIKQLGMIQPSIMVGDDIIFESGGEFDHQLNKSLSSLKLNHNAVAHLEEFDFEFNLEVSISHAPRASFEDPDRPFTVVGALPKTEAVPAAVPAATEASPTDSMKVDGAAPSVAPNPTEEDSDDDLAIIEDSDDDLEVIEVVHKPKEASSVSSKKRPASEITPAEEEEEENGANGNATKKKKL